MAIYLPVLQDEQIVEVTRLLELPYTSGLLEDIILAGSGSPYTAQKFSDAIAKQWPTFTIELEVEIFSLLETAVTKNNVADLQMILNLLCLVILPNPKKFEKLLLSVAQNARPYDSGYQAVMALVRILGEDKEAISNQLKELASNALGFGAITAAHLALGLPPPKSETFM
jgi:hypothetical protein